jgi:hypothetical protein
MKPTTIGAVALTAVPTLIAAHDEPGKVAAHGRCKTCQQYAENEQTQVRHFQDTRMKRLVSHRAAWRAC